MASLSRTEPVTLEHIRVINEMEADDDPHHGRPYQSLSTSLGKAPAAEWNSWGADDIFRKTNANVDKPSTEENIDYFSDIAATIKKTPKIVLKKRISDNEIPATINHSRLQMMNDDPLDFKPDLREWNDGDALESNPSTSAWDDQIDLSQEADEALRESRRLEREKKLRDHQQRKLEREASRKKP